MNQKLLRVIMSAALLLGAWLLTRSVPMPVWQQLIVYLIPYLLIGYDVLAGLMSIILAMEWRLLCSA